MLGTTKPPYTLALAAALFRNRGCEVRLADLTASGESVDDLIARLDGEGFRPTLIVFPSTTPTLDADVVAMAELKARYGAPLFCFGPHASCTPEASMARAPTGRRHVHRRAGRRPAGARGSSTRSISSGDIPNLTFRRGSEIVPHRAQGSFTGFLDAPFPAWELLEPRSVSAAARQRALRDRRDVARLPVLVRFLRRADSSGPQVPREERQGAGRRDGARLPRSSG